jgi:hypothetical protein
LGLLGNLTRLSRLGLRFSLRDDVSPVGEIVVVVGEEVVLLCVNDRLDKGSCLLALLLEDGNYDVHYIWDKRWESGEDLVNDTLGHLFKHVVDVLDKVHCWLSQLLHLRLDQVNEDIYGWETWDSVTLMKHDSLLNVSVGVLAGSIVPNELPIEVVEMELDLSTTR